MTTPCEKLLAEVEARMDWHMKGTRTDMEKLVAMVRCAREALIAETKVPEAKYFQLASYRRAMEALAEMDQIAGEKG